MTIQKLVERYEIHRHEYIAHRSLYSETDVREDFINPFFALLGWDIFNEKGLSRRMREVIRETRVRVNEQTKRPDYEFRLATERKFFVEAKKPNLNVLENRDAAFQTRRYGWSANLPIAVLTNFEHLIIFDTTSEPSLDHPANYGRLHSFHYSEYVEKIAEIANLLSRQTVYSGAFDELFSQTRQGQLTATVDKHFLQTLNQWRLELSATILQNYPNTSAETLNELAERFILRILFLRMCEDRGIQTYQQLQTVAQSNDWGQFVNLLVASDERFDSGLFATAHDPLCVGDRPIQLDSDTVQTIINALYFPLAPYTFTVFEPEFLGQVYEQFLIERIVKVNNVPTLQTKPENVNRDVVFTPQSLIRRVVEETALPYVATMDSAQLLACKTIDPACGSGGFLISLFDIFSDFLVSVYQQTGETQHIYETDNGWQLTFEQKCQLLTSCIYGVDRDYSAVEVAKFSLLVKLLEDETPQSLPTASAILPSLENNILYGDSLIDEHIYAENPAAETIAPPLTWGHDAPATFDIIVGNPPYLKTEDMLNLEPVESGFYKQYKTAYQQFDKYYLFIERIVTDLLTPNGVCGLVLSRKFSHIESGKKVRQLLSRDCFVTQLIDFGNAQLFQGKTTYICLLYLQKIKPQATPLNYALVTTPKAWLQQSLKPTSIPLPRKWISGDKSWLLPSSAAELQLLEALHNETVSLGSIMDVFNGIQTSRNAVYVITEWREIDSATIEFTKQGQNWQIEKQILKPFFDGKIATLQSYAPIKQTAWVIYPYAWENETVAPISPDTLRTTYPLAYRWLLHNQVTLQTRDIKPAPYPVEEWYRYGRQQALGVFENRPKIVVGVNSLGDKYVYDESNMLLASGGTAGECAIAPFTQAPSLYNLHFIHALLNHPAIEFFCRKRGSPFRGGWFARGTAVLKEVPIPQIDFTSANERRRQYEQIAALNKSLHTLTAQPQHNNRLRQRAERDVQRIKRKIVTLINRLYEIEAIIEDVELPT